MGYSLNRMFSLLMYKLGITNGIQLVQHRCLPCENKFQAFRTEIAARRDLIDNAHDVCKHIASFICQNRRSDVSFHFGLGMVKSDEASRYIASSEGMETVSHETAFLVLDES